MKSISSYGSNASRDSYAPKACAPMEETPSGIATLVRLVQPLKASAPMEVTVLLSMVAGISTSPPEPLYFVMVTVLSLTV